MLVFVLLLFGVDFFLVVCVFFFCKQKTAYEMRIRDWSSDVCASDLHIQNGESRAAVFNQSTLIANRTSAHKQTLDYSQRSVSNLLISGKHSNEDGSFLTEWKVSPSLARVGDKDVRSVTFVREGGAYTINTDAGVPSRVWRNLDEFDAVSKVDLTKKTSAFGRDATVKFGGLYSYKQRDYSINNYAIYSRAVDPTELNGDANAVLAPENIWTPESNAGRSEEHTSELQSLMRISYAVFCLQKKNKY